MKNKKRSVVVIDPQHLLVYKQVAFALEHLQAIVGGRIERAMTLENGDEVYVNEEGLMSNGPIYFCNIKGAHQPFAGTAFIIGPVDDDG